MKTKTLLLMISLTLTLAGMTWFSLNVKAAPDEPQSAYPSPTPGPDGRIIYIVQAGNTCEQIHILYNVSLEYLTTTNLLDENCTLYEGQNLMIGIGGPSVASPTPGPSLTPTIAQPTVTPIAGGVATACVLIYGDVNGDGLRQTTEIAIAGAAISLTSLDGVYSQTLTTEINPDPEAYQGMCFTNVPMGQYNVSAAAPDGYNPTRNLTSSLEVVAGDTVYIDYGAQSSTLAQSGNQGNRTSPLLGVVGVIILLVGFGMGVYAWRTARKK